MNLLDLVDNSRTNKNTVNSFLDLYQKLLINKREISTEKCLIISKKKYENLILQYCQG